MLSHAGPRRGFRIVVHSRFDELIYPFLDAPILIGDEYLHVPPIDLRLYNHTGNGVTGFHYDPVVLRRVHPSCNTRGAEKAEREGNGNAAFGASASQSCTSRPERSLRSSARAATSLQEPSYVQLQVRQFRNNKVEKKQAKMMAYV